MSFFLRDLESSLSPELIRKGLDYFAAARVNDLVHLENTWTAAVKGTYAYQVKLTIEEDEVMEWSCDCPFEAGPVCKHVLAVLFAIRTDRAEVELKKMTDFARRNKPKDPDA